jgi:capsular polysaccharide biosynthesis protein
MTNSAAMRRLLDRTVAACVTRGIPPAWFGYRHVMHETVAEYFERHGHAQLAGDYTVVHHEEVAQNPLPCNFETRNELPDERGWWGYSFRDVPQRTSGETFIATLPNCLITWYRDPRQGNDFYPAFLNADSRAVDMREVRFRPLHAATLRRSSKPVRLNKATWITERVYHNHSHWLTAHLPKLLLLREKGMLGSVLLPPQRTAAIDGSLRLLGLDPESFQTYDPARPLFVEELTILGTDRFRPELLQLVPQAFAVTGAPRPHRRVFISRLRATRRRLVNEEELWPLLEPLGFERVMMEEMSFAAQVNLMQETAVLVAPHGAGLTNMIFCQRGTHVVEMADLSFPNPNFYALAAAMGHHYWLVPAESRGDLLPLEKDLWVDLRGVSEILPRLISSAGEGALVATSGERA